jgi:hypothetical protein
MLYVPNYRLICQNHKLATKFSRFKYVIYHVCNEIKPFIYTNQRELFQLDGYYSEEMKTKTVLFNVISD